MTHPTESTDIVGGRILAMEDADGNPTDDQTKAVRIEVETEQADGTRIVTIMDDPRN